MPCPHIELRKQYIADLEQHDDAYKFWQHKSHSGAHWVDCIQEPVWSASASYRRKPKTIRIGKFDVPEPLRVKPALGTSVWCFDFEYGVYDFSWQNNVTQCRRLYAGVVHETSEGAESMADAIRYLISLPNAPYSAKKGENQ